MYKILTKKDINIIKRCINKYHKENNIDNREFIEYYDGYVPQDGKIVFMNEKSIKKSFTVKNMFDLCNKKTGIITVSIIVFPYENKVFSNEYMIYKQDDKYFASKILFLDKGYNTYVKYSYNLEELIKDTYKWSFVNINL